jgi:hypothetical protein
MQYQMKNENLQKYFHKITSVASAFGRHGKFENKKKHSWISHMGNNFCKTLVRKSNKNYKHTSIYDSE